MGQAFKKKWYTELGTTTTDTGEKILYAEVPPESPWFDGHFPGDPTLPGIAQLEMALDTIRLAGKRNVSTAGFRKIRFKRMIRPGEQLEIIAAPGKSDENAYTFRILVGNELACNGVLIVKNPDAEHMKEETA